MKIIILLIILSQSVLISQGTNVDIINFSKKDNLIILTVKPNTNGNYSLYFGNFRGNNSEPIQKGQYFANNELNITINESTLEICGTGYLMYQFKSKELIQWYNKSIYSLCSQVNMVVNASLTSIGDNLSGSSNSTSLIPGDFFFSLILTLSLLGLKSKK